MPLPKRDFSEHKLAVTRAAYEKAYASDKHLDTMIWRVNRLRDED